jgi:hypothetical protein
MTARTRTGAAVLALLLGLLVLPSAAFGAGALDPTFDGDGKVVTDLGSFDVANDVAIQADGKILAGGRGGRQLGGPHTRPLQPRRQPRSEL